MDNKKRQEIKDLLFITNNNGRCYHILCSYCPIYTSRKKRNDCYLDKYAPQENENIFIKCLKDAEKKLNTYGPIDIFEYKLLELDKENEK